MNGSIRERKDKQGRPFYEVVMEFRDPATNNRVQRTKSFKLKREAKRYLAEHQVDQERGLGVEPSKLTMGELLTNWLETYAAHKVGDKTFENYEGIIRSHIMPALGPSLCRSSRQSTWMPSTRKNDERAVPNGS